MLNSCDLSYFVVSIVMMRIHADFTISCMGKGSVFAGDVLGLIIIRIATPGN